MCSSTPTTVSDNKSHRRFFVFLDKIDNFDKSPTLVYLRTSIPLVIGPFSLHRRAPSVSIKLHISLISYLSLESRIQLEIYGKK